MATTARAILMSTVTEAEFQRAVVATAERCGWSVRHDVTTNARRRCRKCGWVLNLPRNRAGAFDLILLRERIVFMELKTESGTVSRAQSEEWERLKRAGAECYVLRPSDIEEVRRVLA